MLDTFACRFRGDDGVQDESTGRELPSWPTRFETVGRITSHSRGQLSVINVAGVDIAQPTLELHIPVDGGVPAAGDVFECLTSADDPMLEGRCFRLVGPSAESQRTARRLDVVEVDAPWL